MIFDPRCREKELLSGGHHLMETILQRKEMLLYERLDTHRKNCHAQIEQFYIATTTWVHYMLFFTIF